MSMKHHLLGLILSSCSSFICAQTTVAEKEPATSGVEQIKESVTYYLSDLEEQLYDQHGSDIEVDYKIQNIDPRLKLKSCQHSPEAKHFGQRLTGRISIKVSCQNPTWSIYAPVKVSVFKPVVTVSNTLSRGDIINQHDLNFSTLDITHLRGKFFTNSQSLVGMEAKRQLKSGMVITSNHIQAPLAIVKGEEIFLTASTGRLKVKIPVVALRPGRIGDIIKVKNLQSNRIINAKVTASGQVAVAM